MERQPDVKTAVLGFGCLTLLVWASWLDRRVTGVLALVLLAYWAWAAVFVIRQNAEDRKMSEPLDGTPWSEIRRLRPPALYKMPDGTLIQDWAIRMRPADAAALRALDERARSLSSAEMDVAILGPQEASFTLRVRRRNTTAAQLACFPSEILVKLGEVVEITHIEGDPREDWYPGPPGRTD